MFNDRTYKIIKTQPDGTTETHEPCLLPCVKTEVAKRDYAYCGIYDAATGEHISTAKGDWSGSKEGRLISPSDRDVHGPTIE